MLLQGRRPGLCALLAAAAMCAVAASAGRELERIQIVDTEFRTRSGMPVWLNGINTAWVHWNDFGAGRFDHAAWQAEFARYAAAGINCARVWIDCDGEVAVQFDADGRVSGPAPGLFDDLEALFAIAREQRIYVLAVLTSFDHVKPSHPKHTLWRRVFNDDSRRESYLKNFIEPLAGRFRDEPALLAWEICNEPEWIWFRRYGVSQERVVAFHAHVAAALHRAGDAWVTTGSASWRWHRDRGGRNLAGHPWSDRSIGSHLADLGARLDFFQVHYYDWMALWGWNPFDAGAAPQRFLRHVDRPVIVGEARGRHSWWTGRSVAQLYQRGAENGYAGVFGWSAHGADGHGNFDEIALATRMMAAQVVEVARAVVGEGSAESDTGRALEPSSPGEDSRDAPRSFETDDTVDRVASVSDQPESGSPDVASDAEDRVRSGADDII